MRTDSPEEVTVELTGREQEILRLLATGTSNKEIAHELYISSNTVKVHLRNIFAKIGATSRTEAAMYAVRVGLVESKDGGIGRVVVRNEEFREVQHQTSTEFESTSTTTIMSDPAIRLRNRPQLRIPSVLAVFLILIIITSLGFTIVKLKASPPILVLPPTVTPESRWHSLVALPKAMDGMAVTAYENQIYTIGGEIDKAVTGSVERYNPATNAWVELSPKPVAVTDVHSAVIGGRIYVPGGRTVSGAVTNAMEIYDVHQDKWVKGPDLPIAISAYALVSFEGRLYLFGGWNGTNYLNNVYVYQPDSESWSEGEPMPTARGFAGAVVVGEKAYIVGGENEDGVLAVNEANNLSLNGKNKAAWETDEPLPISGARTSLINVVDLIYAVVSVDDKNGIYIYQNSGDINKRTWEFLPMPYKFGPGFSAVLLGTQLYIIGNDSIHEGQALNVAYDALYTITLPITK